MVRKNVETIAELTEGEWRNIRILADTTETRQKEMDERHKTEERKRLEEGFLRRKAEFDRIEAEQDIDPIEEEVKKEKRENAQQLRTQVETENLETDDTVRFFNDVNLARITFGMFKSMISVSIKVFFVENQTINPSLKW